jgi:site-specific recombinase XerD
MRPTDFSKNLTEFLIKYLPGERGASKNTIDSYKDTFILLLVFLNEDKGISADKVYLKSITKEIVVDFLNWIEEHRKCCTATRNVRLAAIHSFFQYLQYKHPENLFLWQNILSIPIKKTEQTTINYLSLNGIKLILEQPDQSSSRGRRDLALISLMYDSGARVQELIDLTPSMVRLEPPCTVKLIGKGNKARIVPLLDRQLIFLKNYMVENRLLESHANKYPLFSNSKKEKLTRAGMNYILNKYIELAKQKSPALYPGKLSCHSLRHSKAMHLLQAGVNLIYIRDILGHSSVQVTEIYARTDSQKKREVIEKAYTDVTPDKTPSWLSNNDLLEWLKSFSN